MKKLLLLIVFLQYLVGSNAQAQSIVVNPAADPETAYTAEQLLTNVLLDGGLCSTATNFLLKDNPSAVFPSADRSWGYFTKGTSNFPFERGIILTSGFARYADGPDSGINSGGGYEWTGDTDATALAGMTTNNATVFEFDFVPQGNVVSFNYIFASEEYPGFACSTYNDTFGFIISGPGITADPGLSGKNIALLPNGLPVTINNVNDKDCGNIAYYVPGPFADNEYGGRTIPLTATVNVTPGATYHIRLLVADAGDASYDSAVFLEANSFNLGSVIVDDQGMDLGDEITICDENYTLHANIDDPNYTLQWYFNGNPIPGATTNTLLVTAPGLYKLVASNGTCTAEDSVNILFGELVTNGDVFELTKTDFDDNGFELFNLTDVQDEVVNNPADMVFTYYQTLADAEAQLNPIATPTAYNAADNTIVYCRVADPDGCSKIVQILLKVLKDCINPEAACPGPEFGLNIPFLGDGEIPATAPAGPNYDCLGSQPYPRFYFFKIAEPGYLEFQLNQYTLPDQQGQPIDVDYIVWGPFTEVPCDYEDLQQVVSCSYSASAFETVTIPNAQAGEFYIMMITNYAGSYGQFGYVNLVFNDQNSTGSFDCSIVSGERTYTECDNDQDGQLIFDLATVATDVTEGNATQTVKFYSVEQDAIDDTPNNIIPTGPYTVPVANAPVVIYAQVKDVYGEVIKVIEITFDVNPPVVGAHDADFETCDALNDGLETIDLTAISVIDNTAGLSVRYYENEQDAIAGNAAFIPTPTAYNAATGTVYVRLENETACFVVVKININLIGLEVDLGEDFSMCEGDFEITASGNFEGFTDVTFEWTFNGNIIEGATSQTIVINQIGTYGVTVNTAEGCSGTDTIVVTPGDLPVITSILVGINTVTVEATGGVQPYQYSLTGYVWQDSNVFNNLQAGIHTVYVKSAEGCIATAQFAVLAIPTLFTPNGDGINDTWNIPGLEIYPGTDVVIYDRDGRLVYQSQLDSNVIWDGYFSNGKKAPTQDYWYIINVTDGRKLTGHVTVKSRGEKN